MLGRGITTVFSWGSSPLCLLLAHCVVYIHVVFCRRGWFLCVVGYDFLSLSCVLCSRLASEMYPLCSCGCLAERVLLLYVRHAAAVSSNSGCRLKLKTDCSSLEQCTAVKSEK